MATETRTFYPGAYDASTSNFLRISGETNPVGKGSSNTTYASVGISTGGFATINWPFDLSSIPADATIDFIACAAKASVSTAYGVYYPKMQLFSGGNVPKGSETTLTASATVHNLSCGTWTRAELQGCYLGLSGMSQSGTTIYLRFYGADLTVAYTYNTEKFLVKLNGSWAGAASVYKKVNGVWVEQTDLANLMTGNVRYKNAGEYIAPTKTVKITGAGLAYEGYGVVCGIRINGVIHASPATVEVNTGDTVAVIVGEGVSYGYFGIKLNGTVVQNGAGTYNHTVNENCTINLTVDNQNYSAYAEITTS